MTALLDRLRGRDRPTTAFVLGGGGNLGAVQIGMLRALTEHGVVPDLVVGCSVGALNGAGFAADPTSRGCRHLEDLWLAIPGEFDIMPGGWLPSKVQLAFKGESLYTADNLRALIEFGLPVRRFSQLKIPFQCNATAVDHAAEHWFDDGDLVAPILASAALPAVYPAVRIGGVRYLDGGVLNDVPISRAVDLGARRVFVLHVGRYDRPPPEPRRPFDVAIQAFWIARRHRYLRDLATYRARGVEIVELCPGDRRDVAFDDFSFTRELMNEAFHASASLLDRLDGTSGTDRADPITLEDGASRLERLLVARRALRERRRQDDGSESSVRDRTEDATPIS